LASKHRLWNKWPLNFAHYLPQYEGQLPNFFEYLEKLQTWNRQIRFYVLFSSFLID
ncbi:hypothetical protein T02_15707, partial [Trichinella nativa]